MDIPLADQVVQVGHACLLAGNQFEQAEAGHLVVLAVPHLQALHEVGLRCARRGIRFVMFDEPDDGMGHTALCTEPITGPLRKVFARLPLWGH
jgi:hypothetical protein